MSSYSVFATGESEDDQPPKVPAPLPAPAPLAPVAARAARRSTSGTAPSPEVVPAMRPGWSGGKPPPGALRRDIAGRMAEPVASFSDDEDYLRGRDLQQRHEREERARKRQEPPPSEDEEDDDDTEDEGAGSLCICDTQPRANCSLHGASVLPLSRASALTRLTPPPPPAPMPLQRQVAAITGTTGAAEPPSPSPSSSSSSNVSTLMESAVREAFRQGIEQGKRMQLPQQCKTCAVRKERNRLAAKESRHKKRREAEVVNTRNLIAAAADVAASRATSPVPPAPTPATATAPLATNARAAAGGGDEEELEPPPF